MRTLRVALLMAAGWMSFLAARPITASDSDREVSATAFDVSVAARVVQYSAISDILEGARVSRVAPLALFLCAGLFLLLAVQTVERARTTAHAPPKVVDPRVVPYDAMAPPRLLGSSSAA